MIASAEYQTRADLGTAQRPSRPPEDIYIKLNHYLRAYKHHTYDPIRNIEKHQSYNMDMLDNELIKALAHFRRLKSEELRFVTAAVSQYLSLSSI